MQAQKYNKDELLLVKLGRDEIFAVFLKESPIRDRNILVQLVESNSMVWIRESQIL